MSQLRRNIAPADTSTPERPKRSTGTSAKSPHKSSSLSPVKKCAKQSSKTDSQICSSPDFLIPSNLTDQNVDIPIDGTFDSFSPLSSTAHRPPANHLDQSPDNFPVDALNFLYNDRCTR